MPDFNPDLRKGIGHCHSKCIQAHLAGPKNTTCKILMEEDIRDLVRYGDICPIWLRIVILRMNALEEKWSRMESLIRTAALHNSSARVRKLFGGLAKEFEINFKRKEEPKTGESAGVKKS